MSGNDLICVLGPSMECVAKTPEACLCRQMPEAIYRRERAARWRVLYVGSNNSRTSGGGPAETSEGRVSARSAPATAPPAPHAGA